MTALSPARAGGSFMGRSTLPAISIKNVDLKGLDQVEATRVFNKALAQMGLPTGLDYTPEPNIPSTPNRYGDTAWVGIYGHNEVESLPPELSASPQRYRHKVFYSSTLEQLLDAMAEYEQTLAPN